MEDPHILRDSAIGCQQAFRQCLSVPSLNDESWVENRLGDFNLWLTNLRVLKPGHASLDYRLRDREDLRNVIAGLLRSLHDFVERCRVPEEPTSNQSDYEAQGSDDSVSSWSAVSDEDNGGSKNIQVSASILSDPISGVESTLDRLIRLGMVIRKSGDRFRHELADRSLDVSNYEEFKRHLEFVLLNEQVSEKLSREAIPFVTRQELLDQVRLSAFQQRAIHANITRRNRFEFAKKRELKANPRPQPKLIEQQPPTQKPTAPTLAPVSTPQSKGPEAKSQVSLSRPSIVETATQVGTITTPVEPTPSKAATRITKMSSTGQKLEYPKCPQLENPDDTSFQCPFCCQQLPKKYLERSGWRSHVHGDLIPYICIFEDCPNQQSFFGSKEEWIQHLRTTHSKKYWQCPFPEICENTPKYIFANESDWIDHMATHQSADNQTKFSAAQLQIVAGTNIIHDFSIESCPLCYFSSPINEEETIKHIAEHLHSFALRSLPWESYVDEDQSTVAQAMDDKAPSDFSDDSRELFEFGEQSTTTSENLDQFPQVIADWQANLLNTNIPPYYKAKLEQVGNAASRLYSSESGERPVNWDAIRRMEKGLLDISWIIKQLEEVITPSGGLHDENMAKRCDNLDKDFEDSVSALILPEAEASRENPLTRVKGEIAAANSFNASRAILMELADKLELRPKVKKEVELNLEHLGREIIFRGDLQRPKTGARFLVDTHAILLDHYLVLAKSFIARDQSQSAKTAPSIDNFDDVHATLPFESRAKQQTKTKEDIRPYEKYDVSELPIPMDLLVLESTNDDPVIKSSVRDVATVTPQSSVSPLTHTGPGASIKGSAAISENKDEKILFPFKIKHLGKTGTYVLYAFSAQDRANWCQKIIEAKTKHAAALLSQNVEPFRLRVLADTAFEYPDQTSRSESITISGTPLHHAIEEFEKKYGGSELRPPPVCRTGVKCATAFQQPTGQQMCAVGTDYGVWVSDLSKPRDWYQAIPFMRVTQVAVFEEFNILLLISDGSLIAYHLDVVCPASGITSRSQDNVRRVAQKLSGKSEVGFFAAGQMNDRCLIVYKRRDGFSSTFKVLELLIQKSSSSKRLFVKAFRSQSELFREYDEFYIPVESYGINMFRTSFAISTMVGIQVLTLNKKQSWSVPDFKSDVPGASDTLMSIVYRIKNLRALGMFRLSDDEFLIAYQQCGVYVNKYGDVSRSVVMEFVGSAHTACLKGDFLILFNDDFVEVRSAMNGRLKQVIPGHNVVCLDDGSKVPGVFGSIGSTQNTVKICMQHPDFEQIQIVLELVENPDVTY